MDICKNKDTRGKEYIHYIGLCYTKIKSSGFSKIESSGYNNVLHKFWDENEVISSVIGKNKQTNTLKICGKILDKILCFIDSWHSEESIEHTWKTN